MTNHIYKFRISFKQQCVLLSQMVLTWLGVIIVTVFILKINLDSRTIAYGFSFLFFIDTLPTIIVHTQYWIKNKGAILTLNTETKELVYETPVQKLCYSFNDIISLKYYRNLGKGSGWNSFGQYRFYKIIFTDKIEIVITCQMINDIENTLELLLRIEAEKHTSFLCLID